MRQLIAAPLILLQLTTLLAQQAPDPQRIKAQIEALSIDAKLTVSLLNGAEHYGHLQGVDADSFSIRDVDEKRVVTFRYADVQKVSKNYGRKGFGGKRVNSRRNLIAGLAILSGLLVVVIVAVSLDKS